MNTQTKHEQEYIHIKKETLSDILFYLAIAVAIISFASFFYMLGNDYGYKKGFKEGYSTGTNDNFVTIFNQLDKTDCDTDFIFQNNKSQRITVRKQGCIIEPIWIGNPNGFLTGLGRMPSFDGTQLSIGATKLSIGATK